MKRKSKLHDNADIDMAPLIDMVFLLLVFFMCTATISQVNFTPEVILPIAPNAHIADDLRDRGTINILPSGEYMIMGEIVDIDEMLAIMTERREENPEIKLYLRANKSVPFAKVKDVLRACAQAGIHDIIFATFQSGN